MKCNTRKLQRQHLEFIASKFVSNKPSIIILNSKAFAAGCVNEVDVRLYGSHCLVTVSKKSMQHDSEIPGQLIWTLYGNAFNTLFAT